MTRSFTFVLLLVVCFVCIGPLAAQDAPTPEPVGLRPDAPEYALHGPYWVGTQEFVIDPEGERPLSVSVWYPAIRPKSDERAAYDTGVSDLLGEAMSVITEAQAFASAEPDLLDAPYPLVVISGGLGASRFSYFELAEHLASMGFVVASVEHLGTAAREGMEGTAAVGSDNNIQSLFYRPSDVTRVIGYADTLTAPEGALDRLIDTERIAVWGHSTGGTTVFQAAGAQIDFPALADWCADKADDPNAAESCQFLGHENELAALYGVADPQAGLFPALWDERVDAMVAAAPGGELHAFGEAGVAPIEVPTLLMVGTEDPYVSPDFNSLWAYGQISSPVRALAQFASGGHLMFASCPVMWTEFCGYDSVWDVDRTQDLVNHFTTAFLLDTLKGDEAAHAALAPDAVAFPGIEYQAEGF
ncbi:MAG TPA: hypothetical protein VER79_09890 [Candidatus Limnocylindrales bacterium]|nr:hypothetical protein [Candidatus Limnocylindrales bacterium]